VTVLLVLVGGAIGAPLRYLTDLFVRGRHDGVLPLGTLLANAVGSLLLAGLAAAAVHLDAPSWLLTLGGTGFCGALTTFSTFGYETIRLVEDGSWVEAGVNMVLSLAVCLLAATAGWAAVEAAARAL
jgi:CrcB protein